MHNFVAYEPIKFPFVCGLDLAQRQDYTALVLMERVDSFGDKWDPVSWTRPVFAALHVRYIHRFPKGTTYPAIVEAIYQLFRDTRLSLRGTLVVDATGVGAPIVDLLRDRRPAASLYPVIISAGESVTEKENYTSVPKKDLVSSVSLLLQQKALVIPKKLPFAEVLIDELLNFRSTIHANGNATYGAWRERDHDDLVLALALATWMALRKWPHFNTGRERLPSVHP